MIKTPITPTSVRNGYHLQGRLGVAITALCSNGESIGLNGLVAIASTIREEIAAFDAGCAQCVGMRPPSITTTLKNGRTTKTAYESEYGWTVSAVIQHFELGFNLGNVCKYLCRCTSVQHDNAKKYRSDLTKCLTYLLDAMDERDYNGARAEAAERRYLAHAVEAATELLSRESSDTITAKTLSDGLILHHANTLAKAARLP